MAEDWLVDVRKYVADADEKVVAAIVRHCGIALRNVDSSLVSFSDSKETDRVRENYLKKKLGLTAPDAELDAGIAAVGERMKADRTKNRVTVYYLLSDYFDSHSVFGGAAGSGRKAGWGLAAAAGAAGAATLAAAATPTPAPAPEPVVDPTPVPEPVVDPTPAPEPERVVPPAEPLRATGGGDTGGTGTGGYDGSGSGYTDDDSGGGGFKWWPLLLLGAALIGVFLLMKACQPDATPVGGADTNISADANMEAGLDTDLGNATVAAPAAAPTGSAVIAETREGRPALNVFFDTAKSEVHNDLATASTALKAYVDANPTATLAVSGFNDPTGNAAANAELSKNRAQAVKAALEKTGIPADRIVLEKPAENTDTNTDLANARRVEVTVKQ